MPGLPIIAAGPLAAALAGGATGGTVGGIIGALIGYGIPEERAKLYDKGVEEGGVVMGVTPRTLEDAEYLEREWRTSTASRSIARSGIREGRGRGSARARAARRRRRADRRAVRRHERAPLDAGQDHPGRLQGRRSHVKTPEGTLIVHVPPQELQTVKKGDAVTLDLALKNNGPVKK